MESERRSESGPDDDLTAEVWERWRAAVEAAPAFADALGDQLRASREAQGRTTEQVADIARGLGLSWHRTTVGQIERGRRALGAAELLMLPVVYRRPLRELLPAGRVWLTDDVAVQMSELWRAITGEGWGDRGGGIRSGPGRWFSRHVDETDITDSVRRTFEFFDRWPYDGLLKHMATPDEVETKAAVRLDTTPEYVAYAARETWGRGLAAERDARLADRGGTPEGKRAVQAARGHITRRLLAELEPVVRDLENRRAGEGETGE